MTSVTNLRDASASLYRRSSRLYSLRSAAPRPTISRVMVSQEIIVVGVVGLGRRKEGEQKNSEFVSGVDGVVRKKRLEAVVMLDLIIINGADCCINSSVKAHHSVH